MTIQVDTNLLLRAVDTNDPAHALATNSLQYYRRNKETLCLVPQNLYEFWVVATRPVANNGRGYPPDVAIQELNDLELGFQLLSDHPGILQQWKQLVVQYECKGKIAHDARLVAAMNTHGITNLLTFNGADFRRFTHITVIDPVDVPTPPEANA